MSQEPKQKNLDVCLAELKKDIEYIKQDVGEVKHLIQSSYITREEFEPVKKLVYGMVSVILMGVIGAFLTIVLK